MNTEALAELANVAVAAATVVLAVWIGSPRSWSALSRMIFRFTSARVLPYTYLRRRLPPSQPRSSAATQSPSLARW